MSHKNKHNPKVEAHVIPVEPKAEVATVVATETPKVEEATIVATADLSAILASLPEDLRAIVANYSAIKDPELKKKAEANLQKILGTEKEAEDAKQWGNFNTEAELAIKKLLADLQTKHGVSLKGRKIVVSFSEVANPIYTHTIMGKATSGGGNGRKGGNGFTSHGKVEHDGKEYNSKHALALAMNWKYEGRRTSAEAIEKPQSLDGKDLGFTNTIVEKDGKLFVSKVV